MSRISREDLEYCNRHNECLDCYSEGTRKAAVELQTRGRLKVSCCRKHFNAYKGKTSQANAKKYARRSAVQREAGECTYKGCHHKLIPKELLPPRWKREKTCGMHVPFKAFRVNRSSIVKFILEHCVGPRLGEGMQAQNIIYHAGEDYVLFGLSKPNLYLTRGFSTSDLLRRYEQFRWQKSPSS